MHNQYHDSILQLMIKRGDLQLIKIAIAAGADVNQHIQQTSPLSTAVATGKVEVVDALIKAGADVTKNPDPDQRSLLHAALLSGHPQVAARLVEAGLKHDIFSQCAMGMLKEVREQLDKIPNAGLRYDVAGNIPLSYAAANGQTAVVELLLERNMLAQAGGPYSDSPLEHATRLESPEVLRRLLQHSQPWLPNFNSSVALALEQDKLEHFQLLLATKLEITYRRRGQTMLHKAVELDRRLEFTKLCWTIDWMLTRSLRDTRMMAAAHTIQVE